MNNMYSIWATIGGHRVCIYDDSVSNSSLKLVDPVLTLSDSAAGSLTFKMAPNNIGYDEYTIETEVVDFVDTSGNVTMKTVTETFDLVERMRSILTVYRNGDEIWEGRVLTEDRDFNNIRNIYCEGELAYLNDTCQPQRKYSNMTCRQLLQVILLMHNHRVEETKRFEIGIVDEPDGFPDEYTTEFEKTMEVINNLVRDYGGHLRIRKVDGIRYLDYIQEYPNVSSQQIKFGTNLLDFTCTWDMSSLCTVVLPTGHIVQEAESTSIGDELTCVHAGGKPISGRVLYVNDDMHTVSLGNPGNLSDFNTELSEYATAEYIVEPEKNYYVSCRLNGGLVAYDFCIRDMDPISQHIQYKVVDYKTAGSANQIGFTDFVDQKVTVPAGCTRMIICGWRNDIPISLKSEVEETTGFDKYLDVTNVNDDVEISPDETSVYTWHQKGSPYVTNQEMISKYGWIEKQLPLEDIENETDLYSAAKKYLKDGQFDEMTIEISAVDLAILGTDYAAINLLDMVQVISEPHGLNKLFPVTKLEIPLNKPSEQKFTIGTGSDQTLTTVNNDINENLLNMITAVPDRTLESAKANAINLIAQATNGYISTIMDPVTGSPKEFVISNTPDPNDCTSCWVWNINGLGHFDHYPLSDAEAATNIALTMRGEIVADYITTGQMSADRIHGGVLIVGGQNNIDGSIQVLDSDSVPTCSLNNTGVTTSGSQTISGQAQTIWSKLSSGDLTMGIESDQYVRMNGAATIVDVRPDGTTRTTHGLRIYAEGVSFENCKRIGINNGQGGVYINFTGEISSPGVPTISVQKSTLQNIVVQDPVSHTVSLTDIEYVSGVTLSFEQYTGWAHHVESGFITG